MSMRLLLTLALALPAIAAATPPQAAVCAGCHGSNGISPNPQWPNLAGQQKDYLASALKAYRDGGRNNPLMSPVAKNLSDDDIETLAAYFNGLDASP